MTTWSPDASKKIALVSDLAAMASSVDDGLSEIVSVRQGHTYVWADAAGRSAETGMTPGSTGVQIDTGGIYTYLAGVWRLTGGTLPTFSVYATGVETFADNTPGTVASAWGTPTVNHGYSAWAGGVLTVAEAGIYQIDGNILYQASDIGQRWMWLASDVISGDADPDFYGRSEMNGQSGPYGTNLIASAAASIPAGGTVRLVGLQNSGGALGSHDILPRATRLSVRYLGPAI